MSADYGIPVPWHVVIAVRGRTKDKFHGSDKAGTPLK
jgi:hypothetical protein